MRLPREVDKPTYEIVGPVERYDQRNHPAARFGLVPGSPGYEEYYSRRPEFREWDDENCRLQSHAVSNNRKKDPVNSRFGEAAFLGRRLLGTRDIVAGSPSPPGQVERVDVDPGVMSAKLKDFGRYLGAGRVWIMELN